MRLAATGISDDEFLTFAGQLGATDIAGVGSPKLSTDKGTTNSRTCRLSENRWRMQV